MTTVNMLEAKSSLSKLVAAVESGAELEIVIARNGRPAARLVPYHVQSTHQRLGVAKGRFVVPEDIDATNEQVRDLFLGSE